VAIRYSSFMDPITAAGIALSIASLALQVFAGCVRGMPRVQLMPTLDSALRGYKDTRCSSKRWICPRISNIFAHA
jgi:hypothetical protein